MIFTDKTKEYMPQCIRPAWYEENIIANKEESITTEYRNENDTSQSLEDIWDLYQIKA